MPDVEQRPQSQTISQEALQAFLSPYPPLVQTLVTELRDRVLSAAPDAMEQLDLPAKMLAYSFKNTYKDMICVIMLLKSAVNLGFPRGATLPDPAGLLAGTGKRARHVKICSRDAIDKQALLDLLRASIAQIR